MTLKLKSPSSHSILLEKEHPGHSAILFLLCSIDDGHVALKQHEDPFLLALSF